MTGTRKDDTAVLSTDNITVAPNETATGSSSQDATTSTASTKSPSQQQLHNLPLHHRQSTLPPPPPSPALSTTSKASRASSIYSSRTHHSSSNSTSGSSSIRTNNMSVDDILANPSLSLRRGKNKSAKKKKSSSFSSSTTSAPAAGASTVKEGVGKHDMMINNNNNSNSSNSNADENDTQLETYSPTVESALSSLLTKYDACLSTTNSNNEMLEKEDEKGDDDNNNEEKTRTPIETPAAAATSTTAISPWNVIQLLPQVIQFVDLKIGGDGDGDGDNRKVEKNKEKEVSDQQQQSYIQKELGKIVSSVEMMKRRVMERNNSNNNDDEGLLITERDTADDNEEKAAAAAERLAKMEASLLQMIQIQVWIRMMIWSQEGDAGWKYLEHVVSLSKDDEGGDAGGGNVGKNKKKQKKKKKGNSKQRKGQSMDTTKQITPRQSLVQHLITLLELVPYVLPPSMDFSFWVKDTLTFGYRHNIPDYGTEILDHFEIEIVEPIALKRSGTDTSRRSTRSEVSYSPEKKKTKTEGGGDSSINVGSPSRTIAERRAKRQQAYFASLMEEKASAASTTSVNPDDESATITGSISTVTSTSRGSKRSRGPDIEKDDAKLLKTSVSLTAAAKPKSQSNPFLKGSARGTYVGSHLSSKLSNISTLFREVTIPAKKPQSKQPKQPTTAAAAAATTKSAATNLANNKRKAVPTDKDKKGGGLGPKAPVNIIAKVPREQRNDSGEKTSINETPCKKLKVDRHVHLGRAGTYPISTPRRIIEETPAKQRRGRDVISETPQQHTRFRRQQLDLSMNATTRRQQEARVRNHHSHSRNSNNGSLSPMIQYGGLSPMPQKKNVVAEAAKAAARKRK